MNLIYQLTIGDSCEKVNTPDIDVSVYVGWVEATMPCAIEPDDTHVFKSVHLLHIEHHMNVTERFCSNFFCKIIHGFFVSRQFPGATFID